MAIYEITKEGKFQPLSESTFSVLGIKERWDLQRYLSADIQVISPDSIVISTEFGGWENSQRQIDILALDKMANLVVIELKRTEDGGHMELQALRYAAMVSKMTFDQAVNHFGDYLKKINDHTTDPKNRLLEFLGWEDENEQEFAQDVKIVLASAGFSTEITSCVLWLRDYGVDIRCVRLKPYKLDDDRIMVDVQELIPLPEEEHFQIQIQERRLEKRKVQQSRGRFPPEAVITVLAKENPKRPGSASYDRFALYKSGMTVAQALAAGVTRSDLIWDTKHGFINIK